MCIGTAWALMSAYRSSDICRQGLEGSEVGRFLRRHLPRVTNTGAPNAGFTRRCAKNDDRRAEWRSMAKAGSFWTISRYSSRESISAKADDYHREQSAYSRSTPSKVHQRNNKKRDLVFWFFHHNKTLFPRRGGAIFSRPGTGPDYVDILARTRGEYAPSRQTR